MLQYYKQQGLGERRGGENARGKRKGGGGGEGGRGGGVIGLWSLQQDMPWYLVYVGVAWAQLHGPRETPAASKKTFNTAQVHARELDPYGVLAWVLHDVCTMAR